MITTAPPRPNRKERSLTIRLPVSLHEQLREQADAEDLSMATVLRIAARNWLAERQPA